MAFAKTIHNTGFRCAAFIVICIASAAAIIAADKTYATPVTKASDSIVAHGGSPEFKPRAVRMTVNSTRRLPDAAVAAYPAEADPLKRCSGTNGTVNGTCYYNEMSNRQDVFTDR